MNKTQKGAWFSLWVAVLSLALMGVVYVAIFGAGRGLVSIRAVLFWAALMVAYLVVGVVLVQRRQSPAEPESDERDDAIKKNAVLACLVSVWVSLALVSAIPAYVVGRDGSMPVFLLPIINLIILYIALIVYSVAVLAQYRRAEKGDAS